MQGARRGLERAAPACTASFVLSPKARAEMSRRSVGQAHSDIWLGFTKRLIYGIFKSPMCGEGPRAFY